MREYGDMCGRASPSSQSIDRRRSRAWRVARWFASLAQDMRFGSARLRARARLHAHDALHARARHRRAMRRSSALSMRCSSSHCHSRSQIDSFISGRVYQSQGRQSRSEASYPDYLDWRARNHVFADLAGYHGGGYLLGRRAAVVVPGAASPPANFFDVLGVRPLLGRTFARGEDDVGAPRVVVLAYGVWQTQFAGDHRVVGRTIMLDGAQATVIGVLPKDFQFAPTGWRADLDADRPRQHARTSAGIIGSTSSRGCEPGRRSRPHQQHVEHHARSGA